MDDYVTCYRVRLDLINQKQTANGIQRMANLPERNSSERGKYSNIFRRKQLE